MHFQQIVRRVRRFFRPTPSLHALRGTDGRFVAAGWWQRLLGQQRGKPAHAVRGPDGRFVAASRMPIRHEVGQAGGQRRRVTLD